MSIPDLFSLQVATEDSDWGSGGVTPTAKLMGISDVSITPQVTQVMHPELRGSLAPGFESDLAQVSGAATVNGVLTFDDLPYWLDGMFGKETGVADSDHYTYLYNAPLTIYDSDLDAIRIMDLVYTEGGALASTDSVRLNGGTMNSLNISAETGGASMFSASLIGKEVVETTSGALADRDVYVVMGNHWALAIDPSSDAVGTTAVATTGFSFSLDVNANRGLKYHLGSLTPTTYRDAKWRSTLATNSTQNPT